MNKCLLLSITVIIVYLLVNILIFNIYNYKRNKNIKELTNYLKEINKRNYILNIKDNEEGELSILRNEIYKTSIMLNEQANLNKKDKEALKDSLSDISHQLRTPLTSINLMIDNLLEGNLTKEEQKKQLTNINRKIKGTNFLIESLLKLSKFDANTIEFNNKEYKINKIIKNVEDNLQDLLDLNDIELVIKGNEKDTLYCDYHWQIEALTNIIKNCIEHSNPGSTININYSKSELLTKIVIRDHGVGMNEKDKKHIFDRFYKGENSNPNSIGIGMSLAKSIIEKNNGRITVSSKPGDGTEFTIKYLIKK
jgi:signal transduction histidine kinase